MKPLNFEYVRPGTIEEAMSVLSEHGMDAKVLAGGQSLIPMLNFRLLSPSVLVDINGLKELSFLAVPDEGGLRIGALTRHVELINSRAVQERFPVLGEAMRQVAHLAIRNRGTIGGSLSHADPAAELPMMVVLLGAILKIVGKGGSRMVDAEQFFTSPLATVLEDDELVTEIILPHMDAAGWSFHEFAPREGDFALASAGVVLSVENGLVVDIRLAVGGVDDTPLRITAAESALRGRAIDAEAVAEAADIVRSSVNPPEDLHGSPEYRLHLVGGLVGRALEEAWRRTMMNSVS